MIWWVRFWLKFKSFSICKKVSEGVPKVPRALIEKLTKLILVYSVRRFVRRGWYLAALWSLLTLILDSNPTVSSSRYTVVLFSTKMRSGLRESPVIKDGDGKEGKSAYNEAFLIDDIDLARYERTDLWCQVYLPSSRWDLQLDTMCWRVSDC